MLAARIYFKPEHAGDFLDRPGQYVTEEIFSCPEELIETLREFEDYITDCTTVINGRMLSLSCFKSK